MRHPEALARARGAHEAARVRNPWHRWGVAAALAIVTVVAFAAVRSHEFILYDDAFYVTENARVQQGLTAANLWWGLTALEAGYWHPLTWWSHMLDCEIFGLAAGWHHVTSLVLHVLAAVLLFFALDAMTGALAASAFVAGLFAVHPLHVESVAYIAQRKDVLSGVFWMLTLLAYARYARAPSAARYAAVFGAFVLGLMAKPMVVTLPFVLLLLDVWPLRRVSIPPRDGAQLRRVLMEKLPLLALAALVAVVTTQAATRIGAVADLELVPFGHRVANAVLAYATYLGKTVWPASLACFYPYPKRFDTASVACAAVVLLGLTAVALASSRRRPYVTVGWLWYVGTLVPVIGLIQVGQHAMADRYTYVSLIGPFVAVTWYACELVGTDAGRRRALVVLGMLVIALCVVRARAEVAHWRDSLALFEHALAVTEGSTVVHNNLGLAYRDAKRFDDALGQFDAALRIVPTNIDALNHRGLALRDLGRTADAAASLREAIRLAPGEPAAYFNLGETLIQAGDWRGAVGPLEQVIARDPNHAGAHLQLGAASRRLGRLEEATAHARRALVLRPGWPEAEGYLADALGELGRLDEAISHYRNAIAAKPDFVDAHYNLGTVLARRGRIEEAIQEFRAALTLAPDYAEAHNNLGRAFATQGRHAEAIRAYSEAIRLRPDFAVAFANRARSYEAIGQPDLAAGGRGRAATLGGQPQ